MLVLTREAGQEVRIGADIVVQVTSIRGRKVRLGFTAPPGVEIRREELPPRGPEVTRGGK